MIKAIVTDFSRVLLEPTDKSYTGSLNTLHKELSATPKYKVLDHFELNDELLAFYKKLQSKYHLYIFTSETIQDAKELKKGLGTTFKKVFTALKLGLKKTDSLAYKSICEALSLQPEEILYIDDSTQNIEAAEKAGLTAVWHTDNKDTISQIKAFLK